MAIINLNIGIDTFRKDSGGILNKLVDQAVSKVENKLENAVQDAFGSALNKIGLSGSIAGELANRFGDAFATGGADKFFGTSTAEQNRMAPDQIKANLLPEKSVETAIDAQQTATQLRGGVAGLSQFPDNIGEYYITFKFKEYQRPNPQITANLKHYHTIVLPFPKELSETFNNNINEGEQKSTGAIMDAAQLLASGREGAENRVGDVAILYNLAVSTLGDFDGALGQLAGAIPNPHVQAIFNGIGLKSYRFDWKISPKSPAESKQILDLVGKFKQNSLAAYSNSGTAALQYPPLVEISLSPKEISKLIFFKHCMVKSLSINYAPNGMPSFFRGTKLPTFIQLSVELVETMIHTANDYGINTYGSETSDRGDNLTRIANLLDSGAENVFGGAWDTAQNTYNDLKTAIREGAASANNPSSKGSK